MFRKKSVDDLIHQSQDAFNQAAVALTRRSPSPNKKSHKRDKSDVSKSSAEIDLVSSHAILFIIIQIPPTKNIFLSYIKLIIHIHAIYSMLCHLVGFVAS